MFAHLLILTLATQVPDTGQDARLAAIARIRMGNLVRVDARGVGRHVGPLLGRTGETISLGQEIAFLGPDQPSVAVHVAGIDSLWVRGGSAGSGAKVGAILGGVALGIAGYALAHAFNEVGSCEDCAEVAVLGAALGAGGGALLGALIGSTVPSWRRRFP